METRTERSIEYAYGPEGMKTPYRGTVSGFYTWDELIGYIQDDRWGSPFEILERREREITYGDWKAV